MPEHDKCHQMIQFYKLQNVQVRGKLYEFYVVITFFELVFQLNRMDKFYITQDCFILTEYILSALTLYQMTKF